MGGEVDALVEFAAGEAEVGDACGADGDAALFLDMDIAILGAPWESYCAYAAGIRRAHRGPAERPFGGYVDQVRADLPQATPQRHRTGDANPHLAVERQWHPMDEVRSGRFTL